MCILSSIVCAVDIEYNVFDSISFELLENAIIRLYDNESDLVDTDITDTFGYGKVVTSTIANYTTIIVRENYQPYESRVNISDTTDLFYVAYLTPLSDSGIIRVTLSDMTLHSDHTICIFMSNNRILGCYHKNDTVVLHIDENYSVRPLPLKSDLLTTSKLDIISRYYFLIILSLVLTFLLILYIIKAVQKG